MRRFRKRRVSAEDMEIVGVVWAWDRPVEMTRGFAEWVDRNVLPFGWSIIRDERNRERGQT